jgi:hypothetical protein
MGEALALAIQSLELKASCSHCGKEAAELKRCSVCKHASYCGDACQNAAWKKHKKTCVTLHEGVAFASDRFVSLRRVRAVMSCMRHE